GLMRDNRHILFVSNLDDPSGRNFELYQIDTKNPDKTERITIFDGFDGFPMPSPDGKHLVFCSNRNGSHPHETNVFIADWK
ncbi:MAG: hypothetical protein OEM52_11980, partial [bacterium]|nr:hypothetical protein [bacterium]